MEEHHANGLRAFESARSAIKKRAVRLSGIIALQLSIAYKDGDPWPAHFIWSGKAYELEQPDVLKSAKTGQRKSKGFLAGVLSQIVSDHEWDRFATLVIGLTVAQKVVTHWSEVEEDEM
jgi:hypothetical protein